MSLIRRALPRHEDQRALHWGDVFGSGADPRRAFVTGEPASESMATALRLAPVYASVRLIADGLASLPLNGMREENGITVRLPEQPSLLVKPQTYGTRYDWTHRLVASLGLRGNAVGLYTGSFRGWPTGIEWLRPDECSCDEEDPRKPILWRGRRLDEDEFVHIPLFVLPGYRWGLSPVGAYRSILSVGLSAQDYAVEWFDGMAVPKAVMRNTEKNLVSDIADEAKQKYRASVRHGDIFVTGKDWELKPLGLAADEAMFLETMKASATQIASIYGVPPEMIGGEAGSSLTYSTVEQNALNFAQFTLRPWAVRIESSLTEMLPRGQQAKFNLDATVRSDTKTKYEVLKLQADMELRTKNELRALDDLPPVEGGDEFPKPPEAAPETPVAQEDPAARMAELETALSELRAAVELRHPGHPDQKVHGRKGRAQNAGARTGHGGDPRPGMGDIPVPMNDLRGGSAMAHVRRDGTFTPERQALHDSIVESHLAGVPVSADPTFHMLGGGTAAGKSTAIKSGLVDVPGRDKAVQINADDVKEMLPEGRGAGRREDWAPFTHEESSYLAARIQAASIERSHDFVLDGTGDSSPEKVIRKIDAARGKGYKVNAVYVTVPTEVAVARARARGEKTGRKIPDAVTRSIHASVSRTFPHVADQFDSVQLVDTSGPSPRTVARGRRRARLEILDQDLYDGFIAKGDV